MEKAQLPVFAELSLGDTGDFTANKAGKFAGTNNPRHLRVISALLVRARTRKEIDSIAGCSNAPELMAELSRRGLDVVPCRRVPGYDRDGLPIRYGVYALSDDDRRKLRAWLRKRNNERAKEVKNV